MRALLAGRARALLADHAVLAVVAVTLTSALVRLTHRVLEPACAPAADGLSVALPSAAARGGGAAAAAAAAGASLGDLVDKVVYINLRRDAVRERLMRTDFLPGLGLGSGRGGDVLRLDAVCAPKGMPGIAGAALSHIGALRAALNGGFRNVLVLEDDVSWRVDADGANLRLARALASRPYDVVLLGATYLRGHNESTHRLDFAHASASYLVAGRYVPTLLANFEEGLRRLRAEPTQSEYFIDVFWTRLMANDSWFVVTPALAVQESYLQLYGWPS